MVAQNSADFPIFEDMQDNVEEVLERLQKLLGELQSPLLKIYSPSCEKNWGRFVLNRCSRDWGSC